MLVEVDPSIYRLSSILPFSYSCLWCYFQFPSPVPLLDSVDRLFPQQTAPLCAFCNGFLTFFLSIHSIPSALFLQLPLQTLYSCFLCLASSETTSPSLLSKFQKFIRLSHLLRILTLFSLSFWVYIIISMGSQSNGRKTDMHFGKTSLNAVWRVNWRGKEADKWVMVFGHYHLTSTEWTSYATNARSYIRQWHGLL